jgi:hypothetical protein
LSRSERRQIDAVERSANRLSVVVEKKKKNAKEM